MNLGPFCSQVYNCSAVFDTTIYTYMRILGSSARFARVELMESYCGIISRDHSTELYYANKLKVMVSHNFDNMNSEEDVYGHFKDNTNLEGVTCHFVVLTIFSRKKAPCRYKNKTKMKSMLFD